MNGNPRPGGDLSDVGTRSTAVTAPNGLQAPDFESALDDAIAQMQAGATLDEAAAAVPSWAADLRMLLEVAQVTMEVAPVAVPPDARARVRGRVLAAAQARLASRPWWKLGWAGSGWSFDLLRPAVAAATAVAAVMVGGGGVLFASSSSLPGEPLYAVKLAAEEVQVTIAGSTGGAETQVALQAQLAQRRVEEARLLAGQGRQVPVSLIAAAERHAQAAEAAAARAPDPQRPQLAATLDRAESQRQATLERVLEQVPPPAQAAILRALDAPPSKDPGQGNAGTVASRPGRDGAGNATTAGDRGRSATAASRETEDRNEPRGNGQAPATAPGAAAASGGASPTRAPDADGRGPNGADQGIAGAPAGDTRPNAPGRIEDDEKPHPPTPDARSRGGDVAGNGAGNPGEARRAEPPPRESDRGNGSGNGPAAGANPGPDPRGPGDAGQGSDNRASNGGDGATRASGQDRRDPAVAPRDEEPPRSPAAVPPAPRPLTPAGDSQSGAVPDHPAPPAESARPPERGPEDDRPQPGAAPRPSELERPPARQALTPSPTAVRPPAAARSNAQGTPQRDRD